MLATRQSQVVVNNSWTIVMSAQTFGADSARQRQPEHAEAVGHADAEVDTQRRGRHQPTIEPGSGDNPLAIENTRPRTGQPSGPFQCGHVVSFPCWDRPFSG
jgi:hypothetical protein